MTADDMQFAKLTTVAALAFTLTSHPTFADEPSATDRCFELLSGGEVGDEAIDDRQLLSVLLAEVRTIRLYDLEQLQHGSPHTATLIRALLKHFFWRRQAMLTALSGFYATLIRQMEEPHSLGRCSGRAGRKSRCHGSTNKRNAITRAS